MCHYAVKAATKSSWKTLLTVQLCFIFHGNSTFPVLTTVWACCFLWLHPAVKDRVQSIKYYIAPTFQHNVLMQIILGPQTTQWFTVDHFFLVLSSSFFIIIAFRDPGVLTKQKITFKSLKPQQTNPIVICGRTGERCGTSDPSASLSGRLRLVSARVFFISRLVSIYAAHLLSRPECDVKKLGHVTL